MQDREPQPSTTGQGQSPPSLLKLRTENHLWLVIMSERPKIPKEPLGCQAECVEKATEAAEGEEAHMHVVPFLEHARVVMPERFPDDPLAEQYTEAKGQVEMVRYADDDAPVRPEHADRFPCETLRIDEVLEDVLQNDQVERCCAV